MPKERKTRRKDVNFRYNLSVYLSFLKRYKWLFALTVFIALISEALSFTEKFLFKVIIDKGTDYSSSAITLEALTTIFLWVAVVYLASVALKVVVKWFSLHTINLLESRLLFDLKEHFFNHIITLSHSFHVSHKTGSLIGRIGRGSGAMERITDFFVFNVFPLAFQLIITGASLIYFDKISAVIAFATMASFVAYSLFMQHIQRKQNDRLNRFEDIEKGNLADFITNVDSIKYYGKENRIKQRYNKLIDNSRAALLKFWNYYRWQDAGQNFILWSGTFLLVYFSLRNFMLGNITIGTVVLIYTVYGGLFGHIYGFMHGIRNFYRSMIDFHDLFQYGKIEQEVKDKPGAQELNIERGEIEFKGVSFKYNNRNLFRNFSLKIKPGEKIALVGHSGSGKSTLIKLLYRFYDVNKGKILIDGEDIREFKQESLRGSLSIVPQEGVLFDDTVYNNILFSRPEAKKKDVMQAIKLAQLDKTIKSFPYKEYTIVGERGVKLSGGEKQRVSIARALLADKKIIVLDEATSSLDSKTEHEIQKDLQKLLKGRTALIIAHRLSTIMNADKIVVLSKGEISQMGTHNELISRPGIYRQLWSLQKGGYIGE